MYTNQVARLAALIGEPARTEMLLALMDQRALTARELAVVAGIGAPAASRHLALMAEAALLCVVAQGRHRYHRLASPDVARMLEHMMQFAVSTEVASARVSTGPRDAAMRLARTCYDHIAGRLGVAIADHLLAQNALTWHGDGGARVNRQLADALAPLHIAANAQGFSEPNHGLVCRPCLDWSERRPHLAGRLASLLCAHCVESGWLARSPTSRALVPSPAGVIVLRDWLGPQRWAQVVDADAAGSNGASAKPTAGQGVHADAI